MQTRRPIGTDTVNAIGFGCMNVSHAYGPALPEDESTKLLQDTLDAGYDFFDTASLYGDGRNEELLGKSLMHRRDEFFLASKCVLAFVDGKRTLNGRPEMIKQHCEASLKRLNTDRIDLYYMHRLDRKVPIEESIGAMAELVAEGKIRNIGVSEMSAATLRRAHATHPIAAIQSEYSPWTRNPELGVLDACAELDIAFVAFSPVARGYFADTALVPESFHKADLRRTMPRFDADNYAKNLQLLEQTKALAKQAGCSVPQLAMAWVLSKGNNLIAIPGTTKHAHMTENLATLQLADIAPDTLDALSALYEPSIVAGARYSTAAQATVDTECFEFEVV